MAVCLLPCDGCGQVFTAQRRHRQWCSEACRKRTKRALGAVGVTVPKQEPLVVSEIAAGHLMPEHGILWLVFPEGMRRRYPHKVLGPA